MKNNMKNDEFEICFTINIDSILSFFARKLENQLFWNWEKKKYWEKIS